MIPADDAVVPLRAHRQRHATIREVVARGVEPRVKKLPRVGLNIGRNLTDSRRERGRRRRGIRDGAAGLRILRCRRKLRARSALPWDRFRLGRNLSAGRKLHQIPAAHGCGCEGKTGRR